MPDFGRFLGKVVDKSKMTPLEKVDITIIGINRSTLSKPDGTYNIQLPIGRYKVVYNLSGYENFEYQIDLRFNANFKVDVELVKISTTDSNLLTSSNKEMMITSTMTQLQNPKNLTSALIRRAVLLKPKLVRKQEIKLNKELVRVVEIKKTKLDSELTTKSFSPRLINWVEPYDVRGFDKTLFYTEVNSGLKVGDRVFIVNGNYDNDLLIKIDKYKKGRDGYKILEIDNCKVVLDINYTGVLPYNDDELDQFIRVYYVRDSNEFIQVNRQITTRGGVINRKFNYEQNNIIFVDKIYQPTYYSWSDHNGISSPGFYVRNEVGGTSNWTNITNDFLSGSFSYALSMTYSNNSRFKVMNGSFNYDGKEYQEGFVYSWKAGPTFSDWTVDVTYHKPFITKANFRDGNFDGKWNTGLFGRQDKKITWDGSRSTWESGTLLNTLWKKGTLNSKYTLNESFFADIDDNGIAFQKSNSKNNNGRGFNYLIDSQFESSRIINGNIIRTTIGTTTATFSVVENQILSIESNNNNSILRSYLEDCYIKNSRLNSVEISNSRVSNSKLIASKVVNSKLDESIIKDSSYLSDNIIKILDYDEWSASEFQSLYVTNKIYKFYISRKSWERLKNKDSFFIKGLIFNNNSKEVLNFFDKKFKLTSSTLFIDELNTSSNLFWKRPIEYIAYLSTPAENEWKTTTVFDTSYNTAIVEENEKKQYSIDIMIKTQDVFGGQLSGINFNRATDFSTLASPTMSQSLGKVLDISTAYIIDSDFNSGIVDGSNWLSGNSISYNNDVNITIPSDEGGFYNMSIFSTSSQTLNVTTQYNFAYPETENEDFKVGNIVYLNSVQYKSENYVTDLIIATGGNNYETASNISVTGSSGFGLTLDIEANGTVSVVTINQTGLSYSIGDELTIQSGDFDAKIIITGVSSSYTYLPTNYKIISNDGFGNLQLQEVTKSATSSVFLNLKTQGVFYTPNAQNRYGFIYKSRFNKSKIKSGIFTRNLFTGCLIENEEYQAEDKDYQNLIKIRNLVISESIFSRTANILSKATYLYSHFVSGSETWANGIIQRSIWNGGTFSNGVIKESRWLNGLFNSGIFYNSSTFNANSSLYEQTYYTENIYSFYKDGLTTATISNDRWSWQNGIFTVENKSKKSEFYKSDWESGTFKDGKFYSSKWYNGEAQGGIFGDNNISSEDTRFYNGTASNIIVENANFIAEDTSYLKSTQQRLIWNNSIFNSGVFGTKWQQTTASNIAIWNSGVFNGGDFESLAKWKNGEFNGGKFISGYGWTQSRSSSYENYSWEDGTFNGGEFGNSNTFTNSTWWNGQFNDGIFKGRVWNYGIFSKGEFKGSATISSVGGLNSINAQYFVDSFRNEFYGLWRDGYFTEVRDTVIKEQKIWTVRETERASTIRKPYVPAKITNSLWLNGTFSHQSGEANNVVWMNGTFEKGKFNFGSFNPYSIRNSDPLNTWTYDSYPVWLFDGFTNSVNGWINSSVTNGIVVYNDFIEDEAFRYATFSLVSNAARYVAQEYTSPLELKSKNINLTSNFYQINFDIITFSTPALVSVSSIIPGRRSVRIANDISISVKSGTKTYPLISAVRNSNLGTNTFDLQMDAGSFSFVVWSNNAGGFITLDNLSIKRAATASFNLSDSCIWTDGVFNGGDFHISNWERGKFIIGTAYGMIWQNGTSNYMNAINIFWEDGIWRNGNWYGSAIEFDGDVSEDFYKQILFRGMNWSGTSSCHIWNIFEDRSVSVYNQNLSATVPFRDDTIIE
jgi:hypothetical protein